MNFLGIKTGWLILELVKEVLGSLCNLAFIFVLYHFSPQKWSCLRNIKEKYLTICYGPATLLANGKITIATSKQTCMFQTSWLGSTPTKVAHLLVTISPASEKEQTKPTVVMERLPPTMPLPPGGYRVFEKDKKGTNSSQIQNGTDPQKPPLVNSCNIYDANPKQRFCYHE